MNFRNTVGIIGVFLAIFWVFGLMLALDRTRVEEAFLMPSLKGSSDYEIDEVDVQRAAVGKGTEASDFHFARQGDQWNLTQGNQSINQSIKVESFRIRDLIKEVKDARRDEETSVSNDPAQYGLQPPKATITLVGHPRKKSDAKKDDKAEDKKSNDTDAAREKKWKLFLGNDSVDKKFVYAMSSDRPGRVFAVSKSALSAVLFKNANDLRSKRLFDFSEPTVQSFTIKAGDKELQIKKAPGGGWLIVKPNLGYADYEGTPLPKDAPPGAKAADDGVKALINAIAAVRVDAEDDFVPPASDTVSRNDLTAGKEHLLIQVFSGDEKKPAEETLLVGREENDYAYARLSTDEGTFKIQKKLLSPLLEALQTPQRLRNRDLSPIAIKDADAVTLTRGKDEARFLHGGDPKAWHVELPGLGRSNANAKVVESLLEALQGKRDIAAFRDADTDAAKVDVELGFDFPQASASVYLNGIDSGKDAKDKKGEPKLKADAKPAESWSFGKVEGDYVWVKRTMSEGPVTRFTVNKSVLDRIVPKEGMIGFLEPVMPKLSVKDITRIEIDRAGKAVVLEKKGDGWVLKDASGDIAADKTKVEELTKLFTGLPIRRWVKAIDAKEDLSPFGLDKPSLSLVITLKKDQISPQTLGSAMGQLGGIMGDPALCAIGAALANQQTATEKAVFKFGKEAIDADAGNLYLQSSLTDRVSLASDLFAKLLRETDYRDRSTILNPEAYLAVAAFGTSAGFGGLLDASPIVTGHLGRYDAAQVKKLDVYIRTPIELRSFTFARKEAKEGKDAGWTEQSGLKEFNTDDAHVNLVAELVARAAVNRVVLLEGGPKADQKLTPNDATIVIDAVMSDLKVVRLTIGANFENAGYFTQISTWPGAVFIVGPDRIQPLLRGASFFAKERVAAN